MQAQFNPLPTSNNEEFFPYELDYITEELKKRAKEELFEDEETRIHGLNMLKSMLRDETQLHWQNEDLFLLAFLRTRKFDVKRAFNLVKTFYTVMGKRHELYYNFNYGDVKNVYQALNIGYLPYRDSEGCVILVIQTGGWKPQEVSMGDIMRAVTSALVDAIRMPATHIAGFKVIFDFAGVTVSTLPSVSPTYLWLFAEALQNCFPARFRAVHMVNISRIWSYVWAILKQPLSKKIRDRFYFHGNVTGLHKYFPPSILPAEYEGHLPQFDNSSWVKKAEESADYVTYVFSHGYKKYRTKAEEKTLLQ